MQSQAERWACANTLKGVALTPASTTAEVGAVYRAGGGAGHGDAGGCGALGAWLGRGRGEDRPSVRARGAASACRGLPARAAGAGGAQERLAAGRDGGRPDAGRGAGLPEPDALGRGGGRG